MPSPGRVLSIVIQGEMCPVVPSNFHHTEQDVDGCVEYTVEAGIPPAYWSVALVEGLSKQQQPRRHRKAVTLNVGQQAGRIRRRKWSGLSLERKRTFWRNGADRGWTREEVRAYYESGRPVAGVLTPTRSALEHEPAAWLPYLNRNRTRLSRQFGEEYTDALLNAGQIQRRDWMRLRGRTPSTAAALYVQRSAHPHSRPGRPHNRPGAPHSKPGVPHRSLAQRKKKGKK